MHKYINIIKYLQNTPRRQRGAVLLVMLVILILGGAVMLLNALNSTTPQLARDKITADALAQAKEALIGYAVKVQISNSNSSNQPRPGDLPCPDTDDDGLKETSCGSADGSTGQTRRLGRLPWKTLGLPDLRDGNGERLWYAVSNNFKENTRSSLLNSDTAGTISVFSAEGVLIHDGGGSSGAVAVIIAPGEVLTRQDSASPQNRSCTIGIDCDIQEKCTASPPTLTPKCDPKNYLDIPTAGVNLKDNNQFSDGSSTDGFIQGDIKIYDQVTKTYHVILNDQLLVVTQDNIMQGIQKRVAAEVMNCLIDYAPRNNNNGRYPWAAPITDLGTTYNDQDNELFGRIPDDLSNTDSGTTMNDQWGACNTHSINTPSTWWKNWKELVFYGLSDKYSPNNPSAPSFPATCAAAGNCISINNSSTPAKFVVIVAGKKLANPDQSLRNANKTNAFYYLEGGNQSANQTGAYTFTQSSPSASYNDTVVYQ